MCGLSKSRLLFLWRLASLHSTSFAKSFTSIFKILVLNFNKILVFLRHF